MTFSFQHLILWLSLTMAGGTALFTNDLMVENVYFAHKAADDEVLSLATYNLWGLPVSLSGHDQLRRFEALPEALAQSDLEVLALQETFHHDLRERLIAGLSDRYFMASDYLRSRTLLKMDHHGGLMTLSKFPIIKEEFFPYAPADAMKIEERFAQKGFLVTTIARNGQYFNIVNTHLYAGNHAKAEAIRLQQMRQMAATLDTSAQVKAYPTFLMGDLNINHPAVSASNDAFDHSDVYSFIVEEMGFVDSQPQLGPQDYTIDAQTNAFKSTSDSQQKLDYIFMRWPQTARPAEICEQGRRFDEEPALSDHYAWCAYLSF